MAFFEVHCFRNQQLKEGHFEPLQGYEFPLGDGVAVSMYSNLIGVGDVLINPSNGDVLSLTKKDREAGKTEHYFSRSTGILVNAFNRILIEGE